MKTDGIRNDAQRIRHINFKRENRTKRWRYKSFCHWYKINEGINWRSLEIIGIKQGWRLKIKWNQCLIWKRNRPKQIVNSETLKKNLLVEAFEFKSLKLGFFKTRPNFLNKILNSWNEM